MVQVTERRGARGKCGANSQQTQRTTSQRNPWIRSQTKRTPRQSKLATPTVGPTGLRQIALLPEPPAYLNDNTKQTYVEAEFMGFAPLANIPRTIIRFTRDQARALKPTEFFNVAQNNHRSELCISRRFQFCRCGR
jgi:hypothetical protein